MSLLEIKTRPCQNKVDSKTKPRPEKSGLKTSHETKTLVCDFVFVMMFLASLFYAIKHGITFYKFRTSLRDIFHLCCSIDDVLEAQTRCFLRCICKICICNKEIKYCVSLFSAKISSLQLSTFHYIYMAILSNSKFLFLLMCVLNSIK